MPEITKDTMIGDLLDADPAMERVFRQLGMHCQDCSSAHGETIEEACMLHEVDAEQLISALKAHQTVH